MRTSRPTLLHPLAALAVAALACGPPGPAASDAGVPTGGGGYGPAPAAGGPLFEEVAHGRVATDAGASRGVGWADFDGDGDADLVVSNTSGQWNALYVNEDGEAVGRSDRWLRKATGPRSPLGAVAAAAGRAEGVAWVDFDGDGDLDLHVVTRGAEPDLLFENRGEEGLAGVDTGLLVRPLSHTMACWADMDRDGWLDVFLVGYRDGRDALLRGLGGGRFRELAGSAAAGGDGAGRACAWGDPDDDGYPDLYVGNARRPNALYRNRAGRLERDTAAGHAVEHVGYSYGLSWADYDGDGDADLFVANFDTTNVLYRNDGGRLRPVRGEPVAEESGGASKGHAWGDYDLDGDLDLFVANGTYAPDMRNFLYRGEDGVLVRDTAGPLAVHADTSAGAAWADYDGDGDLDLFVANWGGSDQRNRLYRNTAERTGRSWIGFRLRSPTPNSHGWGAKVRVRARIGGEDRWLTRWNLPTTGYASQNDLLVHFGLGDAAAIDSLMVTWPDGRRQAHGSIAAGRVWTVTQDGGVRGTPRR